MEKELKYLKGAVDSPVRPMACIVGGAKVSSKVKKKRALLCLSSPTLNSAHCSPRAVLQNRSGARFSGVPSIASYITDHLPFDQSVFALVDTVLRSILFTP